MKRSTRALATFLICLAILGCVLGWITWTVVKLDREQRRSLARQELEETIRLALWRMDSRLAVIIAEENGRPEHTFSPTFPERLLPNIPQEPTPGRFAFSPLVGSPPEFVLLHFQITTDGTIISPQILPPLLQNRFFEQGGHLANGQYDLLNERFLKLRDIVTLNQIRTSYLVSQTVEEDLTTKLVQEIVPAQAVRENSPLKNDATVRQSMSVLNSGAELLMRKSTATRGGNLGYQSSAEATHIEDAARARSQNPQLQKAPVSPGNQNVIQPRDGFGSFGNLQAPSPAQNSGYNVAGHWFGDSNNNGSTTSLIPIVDHTPFSPVWIQGHLFLIRQLSHNRGWQGVWIDWEQLSDHLLNSILDLLPDAGLRLISPNEISTAKPHRMLASIPAELIGEIVLPPLPMLSPELKLPLIGAWSFAFIAALGTGALLFGTVLLSERRAAFVSAVTHELRTPLTTFQLYSEMLARDMVPDKEQQNLYHNILLQESSRLSHLVENVLGYAKLENGRSWKRSETLSIQTLLDRIVPRLQQRLQEENLTIQLDLPETIAGQTFVTDPTAVDQILFNLVDNVAKYGATRPDPVKLAATLSNGSLQLTLRDHGPGIGQKTRRRLFQPFSRSAEDAAGDKPGVGLGLAYSHQLARQLGGKLTLVRTSSEGTTFCLQLPLDDASPQPA